MNFGSFATDVWLIANAPFWFAEGWRRRRAARQQAMK